MCGHWNPIPPPSLQLLTPSICCGSAAAVMALLLGFGLVTLPEMLLQPPASVKHSPQRSSRRLPNALSKCSHPEQKLNIQGPQTVKILSQFFLLGQYQFVPFVVCHCYTADAKKHLDAQLPLTLPFFLFAVGYVSRCHIFHFECLLYVYIHTYTMCTCAYLYALFSLMEATI